MGFPARRKRRGQNLSCDPCSDLMIPTLSQVCTLGAPFELDVADYAAGACPAIEVWLGKLETYLQTHTPDDVRRLLDEHRLSAPVASYQGGLLASQAEARREHWQHFARRLELCRDLKIETLVLAADVPAPLDQPTIDRVQHSLREAAAQAGEAGVRLALEFQAGSAIGNNLQTAVALVEECGHPALGICFDLFHFYTGPSKPEDLDLLYSDNLFHVQLCDLADASRELATDADRILPGDGDIPTAALLDRLHEIDYRGCVSVELMNPQIWQIPPLQFGEIAITALRKLLG